MLKFKEATKKGSLVREYVLIKNPDVRVYDYRGMFKNNFLINDLPLCFCWGFTDVGEGDSVCTFQESFIKGKTVWDDKHMLFHHGLTEGIELTSTTLKPSGMITDFITEYPSN